MHEIPIKPILNSESTNLFHEYTDITIYFAKKLIYKGLIFFQVKLAKICGNKIAVSEFKIGERYTSETDELTKTVEK